MSTRHSGRRISERTMVRHDDTGALINAQVVTCHECHKTTTITNNRFRGQLPDSFIKKRLHQMGWTTGRKVTCPECIARKKNGALIVDYERLESANPIEIAAYRDRGQTFGAASEVREIDPQAIDAVLSKPEGKEQEENMVSFNDIKPTPAAKVASEIPRDTRRRLFSMIEDVWDEKLDRYQGGHSDEAIARKLNIPRAWVEIVRVENFGDNGGNAELETLRPEIEKLAIEAGKARDDALRIAERFEALSNDYRALLTRVQRVEDFVLPKR